MRNRPTAFASLTITTLLAAGCAAAGPPPDAYQQLVASSQTRWDPIQVNVGMRVTIDGKAVTLDGKDVAIVLDSTGARGAVHVAITANELGLPRSAFDRAGLAGGSFAFDLVYATEALYVRSPLLAPELRAFLGPIGKLPPGDLTGWLKLGTKDELAALSALSGAAGRQASPAPSAADDGATRKAMLEAAGVTLAIVGTEPHNGADLQRIKVSIDMAKLATSPAFSAGAGGNAQGRQAVALLKALSAAGDLWLDPTSHRILEADLHLASAGDAAQSGDITLTAHDPDGTVSLDPPTSSIDVPIGPLLSEMMKLISKSTES